MESSEKMKEEKAIKNSEITGDDGNTSSVINKGTDGHQAHVVQEQNSLKSSSPSAGNDLANIEQETLAINSNNAADPSISETHTDLSSSSMPKNEQEEKLKAAYKVEMGEVRKENERLKVLLARIVTEYQSLQSQFSDILRQQEAYEPKPSTDSKYSDDHDQHHHHHHGNQKKNKEPRNDDQLVSLSLGRTSSTSTDHDERRKNEITKRTGNGADGKDHDDRRGFSDGELALGLGSLSETTKNSTSHENVGDEGQKEDDQEVEPTEMWPPSKVLKTSARSSGDDHHDDGVLQTPSLKKARVSVRARCDTPTLNDGCQWRKYGQKIAKGNPCPRAYYRCTVSPSCPVRKQVQRCPEDMSILITTYEGTHNHPLPVSATAMASTTSAAASMLQSHSTTSSSSQPALLLPSAISGPISAATSSNPNLPLGLNFTTSTTTSTTTLFQNSIIRPSAQQHFFFPNTSFSTLNSHPTVTLDLTLPNYHNSPHILGRGLSSNTSSAVPRYPSTSLSFSSSSSPPSSTLDPINSHYSGFFNYRNTYPVGSNGNYNKQPQLMTQEASFYQPHVNSITSSNNNSVNNNQSIGLTNQQSLTETISAATKAITSNPKFQSALAAALTSFVGKDGTGV